MTFQICKILKKSSSVHFWQHENMNPYVVYDEKYWVGYEDSVSLSVKVIIKFQLVLKIFFFLNKILILFRWHSLKKTI